MRLPAMLACLVFSPFALAQWPTDPAAPPVRDVALIGETHPLPPASPRGTATSTWHGVTVTDPWRWLEDAEDPAVKDWIAQQNAYTEATLAAMPEGAALGARVTTLSASGVTRSAPLLAGGTLFYLEHTPPAAQPVLKAQAWPQGAARVLVDVNTHAGAAITGYWPSPSGRYLAWGTAQDGAELTTLHVLEVATGKVLADTLPWAGGGTTPAGLAWDADERGFDYVRFAPPAGTAPVVQFDATLVHHALGTPAARDRTVFGQGYAHAAEYVLVTAGRHGAMLAYEGDGGPAEVYLRDGRRYRRVLDRTANVRTAAWVGERLVVAAFDQAPRGRLLALDARGRAVELLPEGEGAIQQIAPLGAGFLVVRSAGPDWWAEQYDAAARPVRRLPLPASGIAIGDIAGEAGGTHALVSWSGWTFPTRWADYDAASGTLTPVFETRTAGDYTRVRLSRIEGVSADGTRIPVSVLALDGVTPDGARPTILYGYGGFDLPVRPGFIGSNLAWLERGGVLAYANLRGGNEYGQAWHAQGQKLLKQNVFDDFHAAGQALLAAGWTDRAHLGILGASNGGLLMGAAIVQHPGDWKAVVARVGIYDMLRHETETANGAYNLPEYGTIHDPAQFRATLAYSPLQNVQPADYPAALFTTGANDSRVAPWQSRKFVAALQAANRAPTPILLLTRLDAGHGIGAPFSQRVGDAALTLTFFAHELGLPAATQEATP